jgi:hypothetical protein
METQNKHKTRKQNKHKSAAMMTMMMMMMIFQQDLNSVLQKKAAPSGRVF